MAIDDYLNLVTSAWRDKPKFIAMIELCVSVQVRIQDLMTEMMTTLFDLELAMGAQLDVIGEWVGVSRNISIPIEGVFFTWDDTTDFTGWEYGVWQDSDQPGNITVLPDDVYRNLIKSKIAANHWDGTTTGMYEVWSIVFPDLNILIQDNQDMSYDIAFVGSIIDSLTLALITGGYISLKPEGVRVNAYFIPIDTGPLFGWDLDTEFIQGWEEGSWPREIAPT